MTAPAAALGPAVDGETARRRRGWGWLLLVPGGLWLAVFFVCPTVQLFLTSLYDPSGSFTRGYRLTWHFANYADALRDTWRAVRALLRVCRRGHGDLPAAGLPAGVRDRVQGRPVEELMLVLVIAPFFTSFLLRTLSWRTILSDRGPVTSFFREIHVLGADGRLLATSVAVVAGLVYNFLPFMTLPLYASPRQGRPPARRGGRRPVRQPVHRVPQGHVAAVAAGGRRRDAADVHPGLR